MREPTRVLQVLGPSTGGIRRHVAFLSDALRATGEWTVDIAGPAGVLDGIGALDHTVPVPRWQHLTALPGATRALRALVSNYDLVHAHGFTAGWLASLARRRGSPPLVLTVHNVVLDEAEGRAAPLLRWLERRLPARAEQVIAVSPEIAAYLDRRNVTTISAFGPPPAPRTPPHEVRAALGVAVDAPLIVTVARLHPQKALDVLLDAVPLVRAGVSGARVVIVGEGPLESTLRAQADRLGVADVVVFAPGAASADLLAAADVVGIPSRWESGPLVLTEAVALTRPVVATPVGFVPDVIVDGETGWLVPAGDAPALAAALVDALRKPVEAARRAAAARRRAEPILDTNAKVALVAGVYRASLVRS